MLTGGGPIDTNPGDFGNYAVNSIGGNIGPNNIPLIGGPLLTDAQASATVVPTQQSTVEMGPNGPANAADNNYYNAEVNSLITGYSSTDYLNQISSYRSEWQTAIATGSHSSWGGAYVRVDGACQLTNPTTAEVAQWAAAKWGLNPLLLYAEATQEGNWDQTTLGDACDGIGTSSGVYQVGDRNTKSCPYHAFPGYTGTSANLARENTCFNADQYSAEIWAAYHGLTSYGPTQGDIGASIQSWYQGTVTGSGSYTTLIYNHVTSEDWINLYFNGVAPPL